jgi:sugar phosphate isomerase/epimerase
MRLAVDGIYFGMLKQRTPDQIIELALEVGADGLNWPFHADYWADDPARIAAALKATGLVAVALGLTEQTSAIPGKEAEFRAAFTKCLQAAEVVGAPVVDCWPYRPADVTKQQAQAVLTSNLDFLIPKVEAAGKLVSFEFEPDTTIERFAESVAFVSALSPVVRLTADTYHVIRIGDSLAEAPTVLGDRLGVIHFSASHRGECGSAGDLCDYEAFLKSAVAAGFQGDIVLQYAEPEDGVDSLKRAVALTRKVMAACGV